MKTECLCLVLTLAVGLSAAVTTEEYFHVSNSLDTILEAPRPLKDRFRIVHTNLTESKLKDEIDDFTSYGCERMVVISNDASNWFRIWCSSHDDKLKEVHVYPSESFAFTFRPKANGKSEYQCTVDYMKKWATFDVYNEEEWYACPRGDNMVYKYSVKHDGIYANKHKIRALFKGHNEYTLWERYDNVTEETDGLLFTGFVDGGMCSNVPHEFNDRASAITLCDCQCVIAYQHYRCQGRSRKIQGFSGNCTDFDLQDLKKELSAVKGC